MSAELTQRERERDSGRLMDAALRMASTTGMRHATVDALARDAGISKAAFYRLFESKEQLFLRMLERVHNEMYGRAERVLTQQPDVPLRARVALAVREVLDALERYGLSAFMRNEVPLLLSRVPEAWRREHYVSDEEHILRLVNLSGASLATSRETACAVIRLLAMNLIFRQDVGERFDEALNLLLDGACEKLLNA